MRKSLIDRIIKGRADWIIDKLRLFETRPVSPKPSSKEHARLRTEALRIVKEHIAELNAHYGFSYNRIAIRDQRTRWGSCSSKRNLNFNYRIVHLPHELARYLVAHELCHLAQMNHGIQFWSLVEETVPDYRRLRAELRKVRMAR
jgi:predicted metal-dependent hydrolase